MNVFGPYEEGGQKLVDRFNVSALSEASHTLRGKVCRATPCPRFWLTQASPHGRTQVWEHARRLRRTLLRDVDPHTVHGRTLLQDVDRAALPKQVQLQAFRLVRRTAKYGGGDEQPKRRADLEASGSPTRGISRAHAECLFFPHLLDRGCLSRPVARPARPVTRPGNCADRVSQPHLFFPQPPCNIIPRPQASPGPAETSHRNATLFDDRTRQLDRLGHLAQVLMESLGPETSPLREPPAERIRNHLRHPLSYLP